MFEAALRRRSKSWVAEAMRDSAKERASEALAEFAAPRILNRAGRDVGEIRTASGWPHGRPEPETAAPAEAAEA
jgi:hypothetical protein